MRTPSEHVQTLQRRVDFLKSREHKNSYDMAELGSLEWALVNLAQREWIKFPITLRKMWSGSEVQAWLDENVNKERHT